MTATANLARPVLQVARVGSYNDQTSGWMWVHTHTHLEKGHEMIEFLNENSGLIAGIGLYLGMAAFLWASKDLSSGDELPA